ncbi:trypsin-like peptidase domain-containing protein [Corynebacterium heidelbergense]|nr:trypsin-like peptidase domain-containing protein [Corynebacterium heidelbergense]
MRKRTAAVAVGLAALAVISTTPTAAAGTSVVSAGAQLANVCMLGPGGTYQGKTAFVTSGHCFDPKEPQALDPKKPILLGDSDSNLYGTFLTGKWPSDGSGQDWAIVTVPPRNDKGAQPGIGLYSVWNDREYRIDNLPVRGTGAPKEGLEVCAQNRSGRSCGKITKVRHQTSSKIPVFVTNMRTARGDSGGAMITPDGRVVGIVQGGPSGDNSTTYGVAIGDIPGFNVARG